MIGLIFGTLCLVALIATVNRRHYGYLHGWPHQAYHGRGFGHHAGAYGALQAGGRWRAPRGRSALLYMLLERLETTPGQDREIKSAVQEAGERLEMIEQPLQELGSDLAALVAQDQFDRAQVDALFTRAEGRMREARSAAIETLQRVHGALEPEQRKRLGKLISRWASRGFRR
jgi:Spy/CpxP family protein refolding chaperone